MSRSREDSRQPGRGRVLESERDAFAEVVEEHQVAVFNLCYRMLGDPYLAEDAAQETFLRAFRSRDRYDPGRPARTWLLSIAAHHCIDSLRRKARLTWLPLGDQPLAGPGPGPEAALLLNEGDAEVRGLLGHLKPDERAAIVLRYWQDLSVEEIAEITGSSPNSVRTRLFRARRKMALSQAGGPTTVGHEGR